MGEYLKQILNREYNIKILDTQEAPAGWCADTYKVYTSSSNYFLKAYDKNRHSVKNWIARMKIYMPVLLWLYENTPLCYNITVPIFTRSGSFACEDENTLYLLFPFIDGTTPGETKLTPVQIKELALIIARLHNQDPNIPIETHELQETFDISFCDIFLKRYKNIQNSKVLSETLFPYWDIISDNIHILNTTAISLQNSNIEYKFCHTDLHGWNIIQSEQLMLIDWEGLKLAPVEADLFTFSESFFFADIKEEFFSEYKIQCKNYRTNKEALRYYQLRRRLEDILEFIDSLLFDDLTPEKIESSLQHLRQECKQLASIK